MSPFLSSKESHSSVKRSDEKGAKATLRKRKRRVAGPKIAPLITTPTVPCLTDTEWQPILKLLPAGANPKVFRNAIDLLIITYLGILEAEANSPSAREVATVLEDLSRRAYLFALDLFMLDFRIGSEGTGAFNTANDLKPKHFGPLGVLTRHLLEVALSRAKTLRDPAWACKEIKSVRMLSEQGLTRWLQQATQSMMER